MPPKRVRVPMYPWVKRGGKLTPHTRGIVFGMHGAPATEIADRMGMTTTGVEYSIAISQGIVTDPTPPPPEAVDAVLYCSCVVTEEAHTH